MAGLKSSVTKSNHMGWSDHKSLIGQVIEGSHVPGLYFFAKVNLYFKQVLPVALMHLE